MKIHRHGSPYDRGAADSYYRRPRRPHYFEGNTYDSPEVLEDNMTLEEIAEYYQGYIDNTAQGNYKEWK